MKILNRIPIVRVYRNRHEPESLRLLADMYWKILVVISTLGAVIFISYDMWQFGSVSKILSTSQQQSVEANPLDVMPFKREEVKSLTESLTKRQITYQLYSSETPAVQDPSK
jgi:hypothetical protein